MKVGTSLTIILENENMHHETISYRSKIIDRTNEEVLIDYPVNDDLPIKADSKVKIEYIDKGNAYTFYSTVKKIVQSPMKAFIIPPPNKNDIIKIQRREYVRIYTDANVAVHSLDHSFEPFTTVTQDISGGGIAIIVPHDITLKEGEIVILYVVLKSSYSDFKYIKTKAEVIRTATLNGVRTTSLKFHLFDENDRQRIIKYCFEVQREKLKRESF